MATETSGDLAELLEWFKRELVKRHVPAVFLEDLARQEVRIRLPLPVSSGSGGESGPPSGSEINEPLRRPRASLCARQIVVVLKAATGPMTSADIIRQVALAGGEWTDRHVRRVIESLCDCGAIEKDQRSRPAKYSLPSKTPET